MKLKNIFIVYDYLLIKNDRNYNLLKTVEELQELALILTQRLNKGDLIPDYKIIEEIGDVNIRMKVLNKMFPQEKIQKRMTFKLKKFFGFIQTEKYKNI
jgi:hypothetical protein